MKKLFLVVLVCLVQSCGYFENDGIENVRKISGDFYISKYPNSNTYILDFKYSENSSNIINEDCTHVVYDSINKVIYTEKYLNPYNSSYFKIKIFEDKTNDPVKAYKKFDLTKEEYIVNIKCDNCEEIFKKSPEAQLSEE
jgi:hypothetical protein